MMIRPVRRRITFLLLAGAALVGIPRPAVLPVDRGMDGPLELRVETLGVGPGGTETLAADEARLLPGKTALLEREVTLVSAKPRKAGSEKISLKAELRVDSATSSGLVMTIRSRVSVLATTGGIPIPKSEIRRETSTLVGEGTSQLFEVYVSPALDTKLTLNIRWSTGEGGDREEGNLPIPLTARVFEVGKDGLLLLREDQLLAAVGGTASATFNRTVPLPDDKSGGKRVRQDRLELTLTPRFQVGRSLNLSLEANGEVTTLTSDGNLQHPVAHQEDLLLSTGIPSTSEIEVISEDPDKEGWIRLHFRLEIIASF
jgi:hypothetical protein